MLLVANLGIKIDKSKSICCFLCRNQRKYLSWRLFVALQSAR